MKSRIKLQILKRQSFLFIERKKSCIFIKNLFLEFFLAATADFPKDAQTSRAGSLLFTYKSL